MRHLTRRRLFVFSVFSLAILLTVLINGRNAELKQGSAMPPVFTTVPLADTHAPGGDVDGDGRFDPGDTILYTVTVNNTAAPGAGNDATGVVYTDTLPGTLTLVPGSVAASAVAVDDSYTATGNVRIQTPDGATDLLGNDINPVTGNNSGITATAETKKSAQCIAAGAGCAGNNVEIFANGSFSYNPPPGFEGNDTFAYTSNLNSVSATGTATIVVNEVVWFVQAGAPAGGDGRLTSPFNCYVGAACFSALAPDQADDNIFLYNGSYTGGNTLLTDQNLIGQGASASIVSIGAFTLAPNSDALPTTNNDPNNVQLTGGGVPLSSNNTLRGFTVGATTVAKISGTNFGTLRAGDSTTPDLRLDGAGQAMNLENGTFHALSAFSSVATTGTGAGQHGIRLVNVEGTVAFGSTQVTNSQVQGIFVHTSGANIDFGNTIVGTNVGGEGVRLENNTDGGTRTFGALTISGGGGIGFLCTGSCGNVTVNGATTVTNPAGVGIFINQLAAGTSVNFAGGASVSKSSTAGNGANLGSAAAGNAGAVTFDFLNVTTSNGAGIAAVDNTGAFTVTNAVGSSVNAAGGPALSVTKSAAPASPIDLDFTSLSSSNSSTQGINIDRASGQVTVSNPAGIETSVSNPTGIGINIANSSTTLSLGDTASNGSGNTGVFLNANSGGITFADLDIAPDANVRAFHATNNTGTITTTSGTFGTASQPAVDIVGPSSASRTPLNMTLTSVSTNGGPNGVILTNVNGPAASVGFVVNGDGTNTTVGGNSSGGTIQNTTGADDATPVDAAGIGLRLNFADEVALRRMTLTTQSNFGIYGENASNFTFEYSRVNGTNGTAAGINVGLGDASVDFAQLTGAALFKDAVIEGALEDNMRVINTGSSVLNRLVLNNVTIGLMDLGNAMGDNGLLLQSRDTSTMNVTIQDSDITHARGDMFQLDLTDTATSDLIFDNNTLHNLHPNVVTGGGGVTISGGGSATANPTLTYEFDNNSFRGARGSGLLIIFQTGSGSASGRIEGNTFGAPGPLGADADVDSSAREAAAVELRTEGRAGQTFLVNNNQIRRYGQNGIYIEFDGINTAGSTGTIGQMNGTVSNNTIELPRATAGNKIGLHLNFGASTGDNYQGCLDDLNNIAENAGSPDTGSANRDHVLRQRMITTLRLPGYAGTSSDVAAVQAYVQARNPGAETVFAATPSGGGGYVGGAACAQPPPRPVEPPTDDEIAAAVVEKMTEISETASADFEIAFVEVEMPQEIVETATADVGKATEDVGKAKRFVEIASAFVEKTGEMIVPTVYSQESDRAESNLGTPDVTVNGAGSGFTLPAGKQITITYRAVITTAAPPYLTQISNDGTLSGTNPFSVNTDDPNQAGGPQPTITEIDSTTVVVTSSQNPSIVGQSVNFTATLTGAPVHATGDPAGTVDFFEDGNLIGTGNVVAGTADDNTGTATISYSGLPSGSHVISAVFSGGGGYNANSSSTVGGSNVTQTVSNIAVWDGSASTAWADGNNWTTNAAPSLATNDVSIPAAGVTNNPVISAADVSVASLTITGATRTLTINSGRTLAMSGGFNMNGGDVDATAGLVRLTSTGFVTRTSGILLGPIEKIYTAPSNLTFPVGTAGAYSPAQINVTTVTQSPSTVRVLAVAGTAPTMNDATTLDRYWTITETGEVTLTFTLNYLTSDIDGNELNYKTLRHQGGVGVGFNNVAPCPGGGSPCVDPAANTIFVAGATEFSDWTAGELAPTAANVPVAGRVTDQNGRGLANAMLRLSDGDGNVLLARTNQFGHYRFPQVPSGRDYIVTVSSKRFVFAPRLVTVADEIGNLDFAPTGLARP